MPKMKLNKVKLNKIVSEIKKTLESDIMLILQQDSDMNYIKLRIHEELSSMSLDTPKSLKLITVLALIGLMQSE